MSNQNNNNQTGENQKEQSNQPEQKWAKIQQDQANQKRKKEPKDSKEQKNQKTTIYQAHDKFFRLAMADPGVKENLLATYLPEEIAAEIDYQTVEEVPPKRISKKLKMEESDLILKAKLQGEDTYFIVLTEHKSYPDKKTPLQILRYMVGIWEGFAERNENFPIIIPMIIHQGRKKWEYPQLASYFGEIDKKKRKYIPLYEGIYQDFSLEAELSKIPENMFLSNYIIVARQVYQSDKKAMAKELSAVFGFENGIDQAAIIEYVERVLLYIDHVRSDLETEDIIEIKEEISNKGGANIMAGVITRMREEERLIGREEGREEGISLGREEGISLGREEGIFSVARNMKKMGYPLEDIIKLTGISKNKLKML